MSINHVLHYASQGYPVLPVHYKELNGSCSCGYRCSSPFKHPATKRGVLEATTEEGMLRRWWRERDWNIAFRTGPESGIFVLDVDEAEGLAQLPPLPKTLSVRTPRGLHLYFLYQEGITNRSRLFGLSIDVRGINGYVLAPPSPGYSWIEPSLILSAPEFLINGILR